MAPRDAFVTLVTSDAYVPGALVLGQAVRETCPSAGRPAAPGVPAATGSRLLVCLVARGWLAPDSLAALAAVWDEVRPVAPLDSMDASSLALLGRPDLGPALTKIRVWLQTDLRRVLFLDADVLPLRSLDGLFGAVHACEPDACACPQNCPCPCPQSQTHDISEDSRCWPIFAAAPDAGWPDCFNSGVFVAQPSLAVHAALERLLLGGECGSFDGADQGLLNAFFADWPSAPSLRADILSGEAPSATMPRCSRTVRLPFTANMTLNGEYGYLPALRLHWNDVRAVHFIGARKPWMRSRTEGAGHALLADLHARWWAVHDAAVLPLLERAAAERHSPGAYFQTLYASRAPGAPDATLPSAFGAHGVQRDAPMDYFTTYRIRWADDVEAFFRATGAEPGAAEHSEAAEPQRRAPRNGPRARRQDAPAEQREPRELHELHEPHVARGVPVPRR